MSTLEARLTALRAALTPEDPADEAAWGRVCAALDGWPRDELLTAALPLARQHLATWDTKGRDAPPEWINACMAEGDDPRLELVTRVCLLWSHLHKHIHIEPLLTSPSLTSLRRLDLYKPTLEREQVAQLIANPALAQLTHLTLRLTDADAALELLRAPWRLRGLHLTSTPLGASACQALLNAPLCAELRSLSLDAVGLSGDDAIALLATPAARQLDNLNLSDAGLTDAHIPALLAWGGLPRLTNKLCLDKNQITAAGLLALGDSGQLTALGCLSMRDCPLGPMSRFPDALPALTYLNLNGCQIGDEGARALARSAADQPFMWSSFNGNNISPAGLRELLASPRTIGSMFFHFCENPLGDEGAEALASAPGMSEAWGLMLRSCQISDAGLRTLLSSPYLKNLKNLIMDNNAISAELQDELKHDQRIFI